MENEVQEQPCENQACESQQCEAAQPIPTGIGFKFEQSVNMICLGVFSSAGNINLAFTLHEAADVLLNLTKVMEEAKAYQESLPPQDAPVEAASEEPIPEAPAPEAHE